MSQIASIPKTELNISPLLQDTENGFQEIQTIEDPQNI
jgi:hypothetical protein